MDEFGTATVSMSSRDGQELPAQALVEPLDLAGVVGDRTAVWRWEIPSSRQIRSNSTSTGWGPNRPVKHLPLSVRISSGMPQRGAPCRRMEKEFGRGIDVGQVCTYRTVNICPWPKT
jgi:hypothetical protein